MSALENKLLQGKSPNIVAASSVYACCRLRRSPIGLHELARASGTNREEIARGYRAIVFGLGITPPCVGAQEYVPRLAKQAQKSGKATDLARAIIRRSARKGMVGRSPITEAAAALYVACLSNGENATQAELADVAGVTEVSLRNCIKTLLRLIEVPSLSQYDGIPPQGWRSLLASSDFEVVSTGLTAVRMTTS